ncbi:MAG: hypothetical protein WCV68_00270 [Candidatus Paceibacterota bacterium]|jgi:hypothetical protein
MDDEEKKCVCAEDCGCKCNVCGDGCCEQTKVNASTDADAEVADEEEAV